MTQCKSPQKACHFSSSNREAAWYSVANRRAYNDHGTYNYRSPYNYRSTYANPSQYLSVNPGELLAEGLKATTLPGEVQPFVRGDICMHMCATHRAVGHQAMAVHF